MSISSTDRKYLDAIEPFVLIAVSNLIMCSYVRNFATFDLLSRPLKFSATASEGQLLFELPKWLPIEETLLSVGKTGLHSMVKHLHINRRVTDGQSGKQVHHLQIGPAWYRKDEPVHLTYSPWFRFAAPPYDFDIEQAAAAYVVTALARICQSHGHTVGLEVNSDFSVLRLSPQLRIEVFGGKELTEIIITIAEEVSYLSLIMPELSLSRLMFPDVYSAARHAKEAGEQFPRISLTVDEETAVLTGSRG